LIAIVVFVIFFLLCFTHLLLLITNAKSQNYANGKFKKLRSFFTVEPKNIYFGDISGIFSNEFYMNFAVCITSVQ